LARKALFHIEAFKENVCGDLLRAEMLEVPLLPAIRDLWHDHVLFSGDRVTGLIDLSAARRDTAAADLSRLLGSMLGDRRREWQDAIALYEAHRALTDNERVLIPILDRSGVLLSAMNWLKRHYLEGVDCDTPAVRARLAELVSRLEHL
jgi:Ser/Thr protein kinase RdoA (MazF antagonist)